jgi:predicted permease
MLFDIRYALRLILKSPRFAGLTLFVLVGGLSISLFTFSFLYSLIYKPLSLPEGESIVTVIAQFDGEPQALPAFEFSQIRQELTQFSELGIYTDAKVRLNIDDEGKSLTASYVEQGFFHFSRVLPLMGRAISAEDLTAGAPKVVVIGYGVWIDDFAGDPAIVGKSIRINNQLMTVVGVMPEAYRFPDVARIWLPLPAEKSSPTVRNSDTVNIYARLNEDVTKKSAEVEFQNVLNNVYQQAVQQQNALPGSFNISLMSFPEAQFMGAGNFIFIFLNAVAMMILLLACVNVGNLLLARAIARQKETAIRAAIGATSSRLIWQLMWEGILLTVTGGILAVLLAAGALNFMDVYLTLLLPEDMPFWWRWGMDGATVAVALLFCLLTLCLCSFLPARQAAKQDINATLRDGTRGAQSRKSGRLSRRLITLQIFLVSVLLLIGSVAAFVAQSLINMDMGFSYKSVLGADLSLSDSRYASSNQQMQFYQQLLDRLKQQNPVQDAVIQTRYDKLGFSLPEMSFSREQDKPTVDTYAVVGSMDFYGIRLLEGRHLDRRDNDTARKSMMISESMAKRYWPGESALEKRIQLTVDGEQHWLFVVGVVSDRSNVSSLFAAKDSEDELYLSGLQFSQTVLRVLVQYAGSYKAGEEAFYQSLLSLDSGLEPDSIVPMEKNLERVRNILQLISNITFACGFFALLLALTGIYGLTSNTVTQRRSEIGVRRAVGAKDKQIIGLFLRQGIKQLCIGIGLSVLLFGLIVYALNSLTHGAVPLYLYLLLVVGVIVGISSAVLVAIYLPTRQAVKVQPSVVLRYE